MVLLVPQLMTKGSWVTAATQKEGEEKRQAGARGAQGKRRQKMVIP